MPTALTDLVAVPAGVNAGLTCPTPASLQAAFGAPRSSYTGDCQPVTNPALAKRMATRSVGPFRVTGLQPAVESLTRVMADIAREQAAAYAALGTAGMLCCRQQRGSSRVSSHSWGTAIDLKFAGRLDARGDGRVQYGLTLIAPIFNRHGWYWGARFRTEDGMHFEASTALVGRWAGGHHPEPPEPKPSAPSTGGALRRGDHGPRVAALQAALNRNGARLVADGQFGLRTETAVREFQSRRHLVVDGVAGPRTLHALGL